MSTTGIGGASANSVLYRQMQKRTQAADAARAQKTGGEYDEARYLRELNSRLDANVIAGEWNGKDEFGSKDGSTVMIHPDFLRQMHDDPALGAKYEAEINAYAKSDAEGRKRLEAQGAEITSSGMYINEKGEMNSYMSTVTEYGGDGKTEKTPRELMEEMLERIAEKKAAAESAGTGGIVDTRA